MRTHSHMATLLPLLLAVAGVDLSAQESGRPAARPVVAILDFTNSSLVDHETYEPLTAGLAGILLTELKQNPDIELVERERIRAILDEIELGESGRIDAETAARVGRILGAQHMITGVFVIDRRGDLRLDARAVNVETTRVEHVETVSDDADNLLRAVRQLGRQLSTSLRLPARSPPLPDPDAASRGQLLANLKYARALMEEDRKNPDRAVQLYREFLAQSPAEYATLMRKEAQDRIRALTGSQQ